MIIQINQLGLWPINNLPSSNYANSGIMTQCFVEKFETFLNKVVKGGHTVTKMMMM
jgi:hypothetical protein